MVFPVASAKLSTTVGMALMIVSQASASTFPFCNDLDIAEMADSALAPLAAFRTSARLKLSVMSRACSVE
ncbi:hypothetical protein D9M68_980880 [compost metagenome]